MTDLFIVNFHVKMSWQRCSKRRDLTSTGSECETFQFHIHFFLCLLFFFFSRISSWVWWFFYPFLWFLFFTSIVNICDHLISFFMHSLIYEVMGQVWSSILGGFRSKRWTFFGSACTFFFLQCKCPFVLWHLSALRFDLCACCPSRPSWSATNHRGLLFFFFFAPLKFFFSFPPPLPLNYYCLCPQPIALKVHSMSSLTHLRRKERGCRWDNTRRNKVMFRGKHSLGIVLYLCFLTQFLSLLFLFFLFRRFLLFSPLLCVCVLCAWWLHLLFFFYFCLFPLSSLILFASPVVDFPSEIKKSARGSVE